ncbi:MAG: F0F1 ATP synthase subunit A, partial [Crocosphaera sp.]
MTLTPDGIEILKWGIISINATLVFTWLIMILLVIFSWLITRNLSSSHRLSRQQNILEVIVIFINKQIEEISQQKPDPYLPFVGTLFIFIAVSNLLTIIPGYQPP